MKIFLIGFMGCGKTHWGKLLSEKLKIPFFDLDEKIEEHEGKQINAIFEKEGRNTSVYWKRTCSTCSPKAMKPLLWPAAAAPHAFLIISTT